MLKEDIMNKFFLIALTCLITHSSATSEETAHSNQPLSTQIEATTSQSTSFKYPTLTQEQIHQFCNQMSNQVQANEQTIKDYAMSIQDPNEKNEFICEMEMEINMQKHLVSAIKDSPEIISPRIRQAFMHRLRQNFIPNFNPERIETRSLATIYFLGRIIEAEKPYVSPKTRLKGFQLGSHYLSVVSKKF